MNNICLEQIWYTQEFWFLFILYEQGGILTLVTTEISLFCVIFLQNGYNRFNLTKPAQMSFLLNQSITRTYCA